MVQRAHRGERSGLIRRLQKQGQYERWAGEIREPDEELETLRERASYFGLITDDSKAYGKYKAKNTFSVDKEGYLKAVEKTLNVVQ